MEIFNGYFKQGRVITKSNFSSNSYHAQVQKNVRLRNYSVPTLKLKKSISESFSIYSYIYIYIEHFLFVRLNKCGTKHSPHMHQKMNEKQTLLLLCTWFSAKKKESNPHVLPSI